MCNLQTFKWDWPFSHMGLYFPHLENTILLCRGAVTEDAVDSVNRLWRTLCDWASHSFVLIVCWQQLKWFAGEGAVQHVGRTWDGTLRSSACETNSVGVRVGQLYSLVSPPFMAQVRARSTMMHIICSQVNTHWPKPAPWKVICSPKLWMHHRA